MKLLKSIIIILALNLFIVPVLFAGILIPVEIKKEMAGVATKPKEIVPLSTSERALTKELFRTWISGSIDFSKTTKRESERFQRTSYSIDVDTDNLRFLDERLILKPRIELNKTHLLKTRPIKLTKPAKVIYREGPTYFKWQKIKETRAEKPIEKAVAQKLAKDFLVGNGFLKETEKDKVMQVAIRERRKNMEKGEGEQPDDFLVQQDIVFERMFEGQPVINSKLLISISPQNKEIVGIEHFNWTPLQEKQKKTIEQEKLNRIGLNTGEKIQIRLEDKIRRAYGKYTRAEIKKIIPAWFQTQNELIPVLVFEIFTEYADKFNRSSLEVINLAGNDDDLFGGSKPTKRPVSAPR